jgi:hypothetical protein
VVVPYVTFVVVMATLGLAISGFINLVASVVKVLKVPP